MSENNTQETNENIDKNIQIEAKKSNDKSLTTSISVKSNNENEKIVENKKKSKKGVSFSNPVSQIIEVESYKKFNEDISETRFYYNYQEKKDNSQKRKKSQAKCVCVLF